MSSPTKKECLLSYGDALREAVGQEMEPDPKVSVIGLPMLVHSRLIREGDGEREIIVSSTISTARFFIRHALDCVLAIAADRQLLKSDWLHQAADIVESMGIRQSWGGANAAMP